MKRVGIFGWGVLLACVPCVGLRAQAPEGWRVPEATIRFDLNVTTRPSHASAGFFVELPDAGLLPTPAPLTQVFTDRGQPVESYVLWHSPGRNLAIVVADHGGSGDLEIYVRPAPRYRLWTPDSGLTPSAIVSTDPTTASLEAARSLAALGRVGPAVHHINKAGVQRAPLSITGDETGRPRPASFYMLAHVVSRDPGRTWIAPMPAAGVSSEVRVNGQALARQKRIDKWGGPATGRKSGLARTGSRCSWRRRARRLSLKAIIPGRYT
jgi:hypothetical protein